MSNWTVNADGKPDNRCRKWRLVARLDKANDKGYRPTRSKTFFGTQTAAKKAADAFDREINASRNPETPSETLAEWFAEWTRGDLALGRIRESSAYQRERSASRIMSMIGSAKLSDLTASEIESAFASIATSDRPISGTYTRQIQTTLTLCLDAAVRRGKMPSNPMRGVRLAKPDTAERPWLTIDRQRELLAEMSYENPYHFAVSMMLRTGMRSGEACSVLMSGFDGHSIEVRREHTKTDSGARIIPLDAATIGFVEARIGHVRAAMSAIGATVPPGSTLCCRDDGSPIKPGALQWWWRENRSSYGCDGMHLHDMRHSFITGLAVSGIPPKVAQALAGHKSISTTMDVYTHVQASEMGDAVAKLAELRDIC